MALSGIEPLPPERFEPPTREAPTLSEEEAALLQRWMNVARGRGIDAVEDLCERPWPMPVEAKILGVFRSSEEHAAWLLVGHGGRWAVAACAGHTVLGSTDSLADALSLILCTMPP
jgi:hypothetical protein